MTTLENAREVYNSRACPVCGTLKNDRQWLCLEHWRALSKQMRGRLSGGKGWTFLSQAVESLKKAS